MRTTKNTKKYYSLTRPPRKPVTPYFRFHTQNLKFYRKKFRELPVREMTGLVAEKWKELPEERKK
jgi:hypothetical protein